MNQAKGSLCARSFGSELDRCHQNWCAMQPNAGNANTVRKMMEMQWRDVWPNAAILLWLAVAVGCGLNCADAAFVNHPVRNVLHLFPTCQIICIVITIRTVRNDGRMSRTRKQRAGKKDEEKETKKDKEKKTKKRKENKMKRLEIIIIETILILNMLSNLSTLKS